MGISETKEMHKTSTEGIDTEIVSINTSEDDTFICRINGNMYIDKKQSVYNDLMKNHQSFDKVTVTLSNEKYIETIKKVVNRRAIINIVNIVESHFETYEIIYTNILYNGNKTIKFYCEPSVKKLLKNNEPNEIIYKLVRHDDLYMIVDVL
jgi:hypothetical protein